MDILDIMRARHSVRQYSGKKIENDKREALTALADECNEESGPPCANGHEPAEILSHS